MHAASLIEYMIDKKSLDMLATSDLHLLILQSLEGEVTTCSPLEKKPLELIASIMSIKKFRIYAYNAGDPPGGRPAGEYKIVLTVNQPEGERGNFNQSDDSLVLILGYVNEYEVFVLWDADKHKNFAFNKNLQVKFDTVIKAFVEGLALQNRRTLNGIETVIAAHKNYLTKAIRKRIELMISELIED